MGPLHQVCGQAIRSPGHGRDTQRPPASTRSPLSAAATKTPSATTAFKAMTLAYDNALAAVDTDLAL